MAINPYERAQQARERSVHNYLTECDRLTLAGDALLLPTRPYDMDGAVACWLDAMSALDAALLTSEGLNLEDKSV